MIVYDPTSGEAITTSIVCQPQHCFLMTQLGGKVPKEVYKIRKSIATVCKKFDYKVIDANSEITGRDFLLKIWKQIAATPLSIAIYHEDIPQKTLSNIFYEMGVAQAMGKETVIIKSPNADIPSDFVRSGYIEFNSDFTKNFTAFLEGFHAQADFYETIADQLENNPVLSIDYLKRAFLITGNTKLRKEVETVAKSLGERAKNSVEMLAASF